MVRIAAISTRPINATPFGTRLLADRNDSGSEMTAPMIVPRNAMQKVSSSKYGTPSVPSVNRSFAEGWKMPERMLPTGPERSGKDCNGCELESGELLAGNKCFLRQIRTLT